MAAELIQIWRKDKNGSGFHSRRVYVDSEGNEFAGSFAEAIEYYRSLHPTKLIKINHHTRKRKSK